MNVSPATPGLFHVRIEPGGERFAAAPDVPLLQAAARAGMERASSCRNGTCRACICRLVEGEIAYQVEWPGVLPEEKALGWILPCVACARSDLLLDWPG